MGKPEAVDRSTLTDAELLDALAYADHATWERLANCYDHHHATPMFVRAAIAVQLPESAIRRARGGAR
jgi:hypothetical protein